ncbi:MAG: GGDEF domain-containing protein, partial [Roseburia sp.]|nr:GGDEF domain-containing protein [Roseburia sp.]
MEKYFNGVVKQMLMGLGSVENNSFLVCHRGDVSMEHLEAAEQARERTDIYFAVYEFFGGTVAGAYEPYLSIICDMFRRYRKGKFEDFLEECDVYYLHRPLFLSYFHNEVFKREDTILLGEVEYEQERMANALEQMLLRLAEECPVAVVLNNFQFASRSTMALTNRLISGENLNIGILLGVNETSVIPEFLKLEWDSICQKLDDEGRSYHIGNVNQKRNPLLGKKEGGVKVNRETYDKIAQIVVLMDFEQAFYLLRDIEHRIKFDNLEVEDETKYNLLLLLMEVSILVQDISKALEICEDLEKIQLPGKKLECSFEQDYLVSMAYMYQGKLPEALSYDRRALQTAQKLEDEERILKAEMMETQIQMSGWYNIFFCAQEVKVSDRLIEKLMKRNLLNHLAYIYIYAYDNKPENLAKAYLSGELPLNFGMGIALAKKIDNEKLINAAYQKNIMIAATNGMYEIALFYLFRTYEAMRNKETVEGGRIYSGAAYNLC